MKIVYRVVETNSLNYGEGAPTSMDFDTRAEARKHIRDAVERSSTLLFREHWFEFEIKKVYVKERVRCK